MGKSIWYSRMKWFPEHLLQTLEHDCGKIGDCQEPGYALFGAFCTTPPLGYSSWSSLCIIIILVY